MLRDVSPFEAGAAEIAEVNMIPLIDVMLVLLVIALVTAPLLTHAVKIELPRAESVPVDAQPPRIALAIDAARRVYWNGEALDERALAERLRAAAAQRPQPELHLQADRATPYEAVAQVMAAAARAGLARVGFVTEPSADRHIR